MAQIFLLNALYRKVRDRVVHTSASRSAGYVDLQSRDVSEVIGIERPQARAMDEGARGDGDVHVAAARSLEGVIDLRCDGGLIVPECAGVRRRQQQFLK